MNVNASPSRYRYCISLRSTIASPTFTPALNVRSTTEPVLTLRSFVRTNAPPLPGFTCWNSTTWNSVPSSSSVIPFFRSLVETLTAPPAPWSERGISRRPSAVTSTMSSIRTPPRPGMYTPGSIVTTIPSTSSSPPSHRRNGASWISSPTP